MSCFLTEHWEILRCCFEDTMFGPEIGRGKKTTLYFTVKRSSMLSSSAGSGKLELLIFYPVAGTESVFFRAWRLRIAARSSLRIYPNCCFPHFNSQIWFWWQSHGVKKKTPLCRVEYSATCHPSEASGDKKTHFKNMWSYLWGDFWAADNISLVVATKVSTTQCGDVWWWTDALLIQCVHFQAEKDMIHCFSTQVSLGLIATSGEIEAAAK